MHEQRMTTTDTAEKRWRKYFESVGLSPHLIEEYVAYVRHLGERGVPVVFEFRHLAALLGRTPRYLASAVNGTEKHYRKFRIPKRSGGHREICAPYPALLDCQRWLASTVWQAFTPHPAAHGFVSGRSIKTNAAVHLGADCILKMDLADFFPSIRINRVIALLRSVGYPLNIAYVMAKLATFEGVLPQGAATSPSISNAVCRRLDMRLFEMAKAWDLRYSRYADDLTFSGVRLPGMLEDRVTHIIGEEGFTIRHEKTVSLGRRDPKFITGIAVHTGTLRIPRKLRRSLRQEIHYIRRYGLTSHRSKRRIRDLAFIYRLQGRLAFWAWVEPENPEPRDALAWLLNRGRNSQA